MRFSHGRYEKFRGTMPTRAVLLAVSHTNLENLPKDFIEYDTRYTDDEGNTQHYLLPSTGHYLLFTFFDLENNNTFTTLRAYKPAFFGFARHHTGQAWKIEVDTKNRGSKASGQG